MTSLACLWMSVSHDCVQCDVCLEEIHKIGTFHDRFSDYRYTPVDRGSNNHADFKNAALKSNHASMSAEIKLGCIMITGKGKTLAEKLSV